ncbi:envelope stress response membrane protein PspB [Candidatus Parabeggiatoa sp. HSG14]|uniref:envelope stress response membrane protein PspB n=1 Tax=Candidatus Parabeggiatoa sp. HSG14 TaxID=3055593 RepID=UPI0025A75FC2|nr:envelope stress response membrane protein PspB [Thiotrichales bacterium HSG14]
MILNIITLFVSFMLLMIFALFVIPIWLGLHYRWKAKTKNSVSNKEVERIQALQNQTDKLEQRVKILESILDNRVPDWRKPR